MKRKFVRFGVAGEARQLMARRLARAGGHHQQDIVALDRRAADGFLVRPEAAEAERR